MVLVLTLLIGFSADDEVFEGALGEVEENG